MWVGAANTIPVHVTFYNYNGLKVSKVQITQNNASLYATAGNIQGSNDNSTYTNIGTFSGTKSGTFDITCSTTAYYKYIRYYISTGVGGRCDTQSITISGQTKI